MFIIFLLIKYCLTTDFIPDITLKSQRKKGKVLCNETICGFLQKGIVVFCNEITTSILHFFIIFQQL